MERNFPLILMLPLTEILHLVAVSYAAVPPRIISEPAAENWYRPNEPLELVCEADGNPPIRYSWLKDGLLVTNQASENGTLIIDGANPDRDNGIYQCHAMNDYGTAVSTRTPVQHAVQNEFPPVQQPAVNAVQVGDPLVLTCNPPSGQPRGVVYWAVTGSDGSKSKGRLKPVENNERIMSDYDGNLYFANVEQSDSRDGVRYVCIVGNIALRLLLPGQDQTIQPVLIQPRLEPPRLMWANSSHRIAIKGHQFKMKCIFSGYPTPTVTWSYVGADPTRRLLSRSGHEMVIDNVQSTDAGTYQCSANNSQNSDHVTHSFQISVEAAPSWKNGRQPPTDVCAIERQSVELQCAADGNPSPTVTWFINGIAASDDERRTISGDTLRYSAVTASDTQVVQCNVSNPHGYLFVNIRLLVLDASASLSSQITAGFVCDVPQRGNSVTEPSIDAVRKNISGRIQSIDSLAIGSTIVLTLFLLFSRKQIV